MCITELTEKQAHVTRAYFCERRLYFSESQGSRLTVENQKNRGNPYK